jgi:hypothetical protein
VIARNRTNRGDDDLVLSHIDELNIDQLWLMAVDVGDGLTTADAYAIQRFRENGGGVLTARGHHDLGRCLSRLGSLGVAYEFHSKTVDAWPNYHSGASPDFSCGLAVSGGGGAGRLVGLLVAGGYGKSPGVAPVGGLS